MAVVWEAAVKVSKKISLSILSPPAVTDIIFIKYIDVKIIIMYYKDMKMIFTEGNKMKKNISVIENINRLYDSFFEQEKKIGNYSCEKE